MPKRSSKNPQDVNVLAADIVAEATGDSDKNPAAVALGRLGGHIKGDGFNSGGFALLYPVGDKPIEKARPRGEDALATAPTRYAGRGAAEALGRGGSLGSGRGSRAGQRPAPGEISLRPWNASGASERSSGFGIVL